MHHGFRPLGQVIDFTGFRIFILNIRQRIFRENYFRVRPVPPVFRYHQHGTAGSEMFGKLITQVLQIKTIVPVAEIGLVIIGPAGPAPHFRGMYTIGAERLITVNTNCLTQTAVVKSFICLLPSDVFNRFCSCFGKGRGHFLASQPGRIENWKQQDHDCGKTPAYRNSILTHESLLSVLFSRPSVYCFPILSG